MKLYLKKIKKKLKEFSNNYKNIQFYNDNEKVVLLDLNSKSKVRTYLYIIHFIKQNYQEPIIIPFSIFKSIILAKYINKNNNIFFANPFKKYQYVQLLSTTKSKGLHITYNYKKVYSTATYIPNALPYIMHPELYDFSNLGVLNKKIGILMSGNFEKKIYNSDVIKSNFNFNNRWEIYNKVIKNKNVVTITGKALIENLEFNIYKDKLVIMQWHSGAIPINKWCHYLSSANFLFCAPGMTMPLCHNVIEAMSLGVIPILNYNNWLNPSLTDRLNCFVYNSLDEIDDVIQKALFLSGTEILEMKSQVIKFYDLYYKNYSFENSTNNELIVVNENIKDLV